MFLLLLVKRFLEEFRTLLQYHTIEFGKIGRVISHGIFHKEDALDADSQDIVVCILQVLEQLDDSHDEISIAMPAEHIIDGGCIERSKPAIYLLGKMSKKHERQTSSFLLEV
jgi:hypothetical protein